MIDARRIFESLEREAQTIARDFQLDARLDQAKQIAADAKKRLETDPQARTVAAGAGGLLLLGLLGSRGGRRLVGDIAQTGAVAALGALAYKAWADHRGKKTAGEPSEADLRQSGYALEAEQDPEFAASIMHAMLAAAAADGVIDESERAVIDAALDRAGADAQDRRAITGDLGESERFELIERGARTPNHAAEIFAAACAVARGDAPAERAFLDRLANALSIHPDHAQAIIRAATQR